MSSRAERRRETKVEGELDRQIALLKLRAQQGSLRLAMTETEAQRHYAADQEAFLELIKTTKPHAAIIHGWQVVLSITEFSDGRERWHMSCQLHPVGRSSTTLDWQQLGRITATMGAPRDPVTPVETTHPNAPHHWDWTAERVGRVEKHEHPSQQPLSDEQLKKLLAWLDEHYEKAKKCGLLEQKVPFLAILAGHHALGITEYPGDHGDYVVAATAEWLAQRKKVPS